MNVLVSDVPATLSVLCCGWAGPVRAGRIGAAGTVCVCMGLFIPVAGLAVNLWLPRLDCENDTVVKQSASSMIGIFGGMLVVGLAHCCGLLAASCWLRVVRTWPRPRAGGRGVGLALAARFRRILQKLWKAGRTWRKHEKRETRIQKAGGVIGGVIGIAFIVFAMASSPIVFR